MEDRGERRKIGKKLQISEIVLIFAAEDLKKGRHYVYMYC
jgi:hypothetical protein